MSKAKQTQKQTAQNPKMQITLTAEKSKQMKLILLKPTSRVTEVRQRLFSGCIKVITENCFYPHFFGV